jgi:hypothetical protein
MLFYSHSRLKKLICNNNFAKAQIDSHSLFQVLIFTNGFNIMLVNNINVSRLKSGAINKS